MSKPIITLSDGTPLNMRDNNINPLIGYQAMHRVTGRIFPGTNRDEYYTMKAMVKRFKDQYIAGNVASPMEWDFVPFYESEVKAPFKLITINNV